VVSVCWRAAHRKGGRGGAGARRRPAREEKGGRRTAEGTRKRGREGNVRRRTGCPKVGPRDNLSTHCRMNLQWSSSLSVFLRQSTHSL
jgi:hypothetical protein